MTRTILRFDIPDGVWEPSKDPDDGRLLVTLHINGAPHHMEAIPVRYRDPAEDTVTIDADIGGVQEGATPIADEVLSEVYEAVGGDGGWRTVEIGGKPYALIVTPFCN